MMMPCLHFGSRHSMQTKIWPDITTSITSETELENHKEDTQWKQMEFPEEISHYLTIVKQITYNQWKGKVSKWKKATTMSPLGQHLGHFKPLFVYILKILRHWKENY
eukprot:10334293-Ditylum_brightwellii.AAC.1